MTAGEYIGVLLKKHKISQIEATKRLGIKSRNTLNRLIKDYTATEKSIALVKRLAEVFDFSDEEKENIRQLIQNKDKNAKNVKINEILETIYRRDAAGGFCVKRGSEALLLKNILKKCSGQNNIIYSANLHDEKLIYDIIEFLDNENNTVLYNYLAFPRNRVIAAYEVLMLIAAMHNPNYIPVQRDVEFTGIRIITQKQGKYYLYCVESINNEYTFFETEITPELYRFIQAKYDSITAESADFSMPVKSISDYKNILGSLMNVKSDYLIYSEGSPCFGEVSFKTVYRMLEDANFFGFPKEHPYINNLIEMYKNKEKIFKANDMKKWFLFETDKIKYEMQTGITHDHFGLFDSMTREETKELFRWYIEQAKIGEKIEFRFLKDGYSTDKPYVFSEEFLYLYRSYKGYENGVQFEIANANVISVLKIFFNHVRNELTLSKEASIAMLEEMAEKYLQT